MQLINLLSQKLDTEAKQAMAKATQAAPGELEKGLNQLTRLFLGVLVHPPLTSSRVESIQQVVDEGGHTGDLLSNLPNLLGDEQRSSLLIDIGTKIFNHFYEGDTETLIEKLTMVLSIRKPVIQALLGLTPPLVLGVLGSQMRKERWDQNQLQTYLEAQQADVEAELSPYLTPHLANKAQSLSGKDGIKYSSSSKKSVKKKSNFSFLLWLPWILLGLLVAASGWYIRTLQNDSLRTIEPIADTLSVMTDDTNLEQVEARLNQRPDSTNPSISTPAPVISSEQVPVKPQETATPRPVAPKIQNESSPTEVAKKASVPARAKKIENSEPVEKTIASSDLSTALRTTFQSGSAEIKEDQAIKNVATKWLETKSGTVVIEGNLSNRLTEDQAYAIREKLFQLGVPVSSIRFEKSKTPLQVTLK